jgi:hypothetical protein
MMLAVLCCVMALSVSAFAASPDGEGYYASNENGEETPPDAIDQISISTENVPTPTGSGGEPGISWDVDAVELEDAEDFLSGFLSMFGGTSLTPHGNMTLVDDILQDESYYVQDEKVVKDKQFITVESKNGNYFYIIIDRSGDTENVYFLNLVDEADLLALMENGEKDTSAPTCTCKDHCEPGEVNTDCPVCKTNMSECMGKQAVKTDAEKNKQTDVDKDTDTQSEPAEKKSSSGLLALVLILILAGGALYWFKFRKKKPDTKGSSDLDDYDFGEEDEDDAEYEVEPDEAESSDQE